MEKLIKSGVDGGECDFFMLLDNDVKKENLESVHILKMNKRGLRKFMKRYKK